MSGAMRCFTRRSAALRVEPLFGVSMLRTAPAIAAGDGVISFSRGWAMPCRDTFSVEPIGAFVRRYLEQSIASIDPFARDSRLATVTNDLDPSTTAEYHMDAEDFCYEMHRQGRSFDLAIFDPPYSPRQISECYGGIGRQVTAKDTQNAALYRRVREALRLILRPGAGVLSFGWNSAGMGRKRGFSIIEIMLVAHGGAHNDTICLAERNTHLAEYPLEWNAIAAATGTAKTPEAVECEASQSGPAFAPLRKAT